MVMAYTGCLVSLKKCCQNYTVTYSLRCVKSVATGITIQWHSSYVLDDNASLYYEQLQDDGRADVKKPKHAKQCGTCGLSHRTGRKCDQPGCKGFLKDTIINFGDNLEDDIFSNTEEHAKKNDLCLCLGTTLRMTLACELVESGQKPLRLAICNRQKTGLDDVCYSTHNSEYLGVRVLSCVSAGDKREANSLLHVLTLLYSY